jgi:hypothetical protein
MAYDSLPGLIQPGPAWGSADLAWQLLDIFRRARRIMHGGGAAPSGGLGGAAVPGVSVPVVRQALYRMEGRGLPSDADGAVFSMAEGVPFRLSQGVSGRRLGQSGGGVWPGLAAARAVSRVDTARRVQVVAASTMARQSGPMAADILPGAEAPATRGLRRSIRPRGRPFALAAAYAWDEGGGWSLRGGQSGALPGALSGATSGAWSGALPGAWSGALPGVLSGRPAGVLSVRRRGVRGGLSGGRGRLWSGLSGSGFTGAQAWGAGIGMGHVMQVLSGVGPGLTADTLALAVLRARLPRALAAQSGVDGWPEGPYGFGPDGKSGFFAPWAGGGAGAGQSDLMALPSQGNRAYVSGMNTAVQAAMTRTALAPVAAEQRRNTVAGREAFSHTRSECKAFSSLSAEGARSVSSLKAQARYANMGMR